MFTNRLNLNPDKTEFMLIGNKPHRNKVNSKFPVDIPNNSIQPAAHAKNLGIYIYSDLNFQYYIKNTVKMCNYFIRDIHCFRKHLNLDTSTALANALVRSSRLDYCNSLLHSIPRVHLNTLQCVQNYLARVVTKSTRFISSKPLLDRLYWLPIASRIDFKIATLTHEAVHLKQPPSLAKHLKHKSKHINIRKNDQLLLQHPPVGTNSYGHRAFRYTAVTVWNIVPDYIRNAPSVMSFRKLRKTYYFGHLSRPPDS